MRWRSLLALAVMTALLSPALSAQPEETAEVLLTRKIEDHLDALWHAPVALYSRLNEDLRQVGVPLRVRHRKVVYQLTAALEPRWTRLQAQIRRGEPLDVVASLRILEADFQTESERLAAWESATLAELQAYLQLALEQRAAQRAFQGTELAFVSTAIGRLAREDETLHEGLYGNGEGPVRVAAEWDRTLRAESLRGRFQSALDQLPLMAQTAPLIGEEWSLIDSLRQGLPAGEQQGVRTRLARFSEDLRTDVRDARDHAALARAVKKAELATTDLRRFVEGRRRVLGEITKTELTAKNARGRIEALDPLISKEPGFREVRQRLTAAALALAEREKVRLDPTASENAFDQRTFESSVVPLLRIDPRWAERFEQVRSRWQAQPFAGPETLARQQRETFEQFETQARAILDAHCEQARELETRLKIWSVDVAKEHAFWNDLQATFARIDQARTHVRDAHVLAVPSDPVAAWFLARSEAYPVEVADLVETRSARDVGQILGSLARGLEEAAHILRENASGGSDHRMILARRVQLGAGVRLRGTVFPEEGDERDLWCLLAPVGTKWTLRVEVPEEGAGAPIEVVPWNGSWDFSEAMPWELPVLGTRRVYELEGPVFVRVRGPGGPFAYVLEARPLGANEPLVRDLEDVRLPFLSRLLGGER